MSSTARARPFIPLPDELSPLFDSIAETLRSEMPAGQVVHNRQDLLSNFQQFLAIANQLNRKDLPSGPDIKPDEITELGEYGLSLLHEISESARERSLKEALGTLDQLTLGTTDWIIRAGGKIEILEPIVNALAGVANSTSDQRQMILLTQFMGRISVSCTDRIKHDLDLGNPDRPWRLLQMNRGITATRSHDPAVMQAVFDDIAIAIPHDAPEFFAEGMREMDTQTYPDFVRNIMQDYYEKYSHPRGH